MQPDPSRGDGWREAAIFLVIGAVALTLLSKDHKVGTYIGLVVGMVFYVAFVALLSKFGYQRQSIREARERRQAVAAARPAAAAGAQARRQRPAPTHAPAPGRRSDPTVRPRSGAADYGDIDGE